MSVLDAAVLHRRDDRDGRLRRLLLPRAARLAAALGDHPDGRRRDPGRPSSSRCSPTPWSPASSTTRSGRRRITGLGDHVVVVGLGSIGVAVVDGWGGGGGRGGGRADPDNRFLGQVPGPGRPGHHRRRDLVDTWPSCASTEARAVAVLTSTTWSTSRPAWPCATCSATRWVRRTGGAAPLRPAPRRDPGHQLRLPPRPVACGPGRAVVRREPRSAST